MPTREHMTWIPEQRRWTKRYRGKRYYISAKALGCHETKEGSLQAANAWWTTQRAAIDLAIRENVTPPRQPQPQEDVIAALLGRQSFTETKEIAETVRAALQAPPPADLEPIAERIRQFANAEPSTSQVWERFVEQFRLRLWSVLGRSVFNGEPLPDVLKENLSPARVAQLERGAKEIRGEQAAEPSRTVKALMEEWLSTLIAQVAVEAISDTRYDRIKQTVCHFVSFVGETADVNAVNAEVLEGFYHHCLEMIAKRRQDEDEKEGWSDSHSKQVFAVAKQFVAWLSERGTIPLPSNFRRKWRFGSTTKSIKTWTLDEVRKVVSTATGKKKLCLLLMLNCGYLQLDVSELRDDEVDWRKGRIRRKRAKTKKYKDVPVVDYKLWPETFALLKEHRSGKERVLLTKGGKPYTQRRLVGDKVKAVDSWGWMLRKLKNRCGVNKPLKLLRKTTATLLESHETYGRCTSLYLGHVPRSMADKHYAAPAQELFDRAVTWLGQQLGIA
jgi:integrase